MTSSQGKMYRFYNKIPLLTREELEEKEAVFKTLGITPEAWLQNPILFQKCHILLEQQFLQLQEGGFHSVDAVLLSNYDTCSKKTIRLLKKHGLIKEDVNVAQSFTSYLNPREEQCLDIHKFTDDDIFEEIHHTILTRYLVWRLKSTPEIIEKFCTTNLVKTVKSYRHVCERLEALESIGLVPVDILKHGLLLKIPTYNLTAVLDLPTLAGMNTAAALRLHPTIIGKPVAHYIEIYTILKNAGISDVRIQSYMDIFAMNPELLQLRVNEMLSIPELHVLVNSPGILYVIRNYNEARSRFSFLQELKFRCLTSSLLCKPTSDFNVHIREGRDVTSIAEVVALLQRLLKSNCSTIATNIKKHPGCCYVPLLDIKKSYLCLRENYRFTNRVIMEVIQVVLYPREKIIETYSMINTYPGLCANDMTSLQKLNLILYFLERNDHFNGNGIWRREI